MNYSMIQPTLMGLYFQGNRCEIYEIQVHNTFYGIIFINFAS